MFCFRLLVEKPFTHLFFSVIFSSVLCSTIFQIVIIFISMCAELIYYSSIWLKFIWFLFLFFFCQNFTNKSIIILFVGLLESIGMDFSFNFKHFMCSFVLHYVEIHFSFSWRQNTSHGMHVSHSHAHQMLYFNVSVDKM